MKMARPLKVIKITKAVFFIGVPDQVEVKKKYTVGIIHLSNQKLLYWHCCFVYKCSKDWIWETWITNNSMAYSKMVVNQN